MSKFRVEKGRAEAELTLANGETLRGCFFVAKWSATRGGPERVVDLLNAEPGFFPFEAKEFERTVLVNRAHVVAARLAADGEAARDSGYDVAPVREVVMRLSNRMVLRGNIRIYGPEGRDRLSDYARSAEPFRYLEARDGTFVVNSAHIVDLSEIV